MQAADKPMPLAQGKYEALMRYREMLLAAGFREPVKRSSGTWHWRFYKPLTALTAFIVNLHAHDDRIDVAYGCASTAFTLMANDGDALTSLGVDDDEITLRAGLSIYGSADEGQAAALIRRMYDRYAETDKDALLALAREKRKAFIQKIAVRLKPLGFKKKASTWTRTTPEGYVLTVHVQKSSYSDRYYFNVHLRREGMIGVGCCYDVRLAPEGEKSGSWCMDWQLIAPEAIDAFLDGRVLPVLAWLIHTPYEVLGADPTVWANCSCSRKACEVCWVHKNLWEARSTE